ncbi:MAG: glycosyltransferase family 2 protein, partial [Candidatus Coatesbacteria bacterium]|nr:glycosyltransferase family 2 protein [Candidatus Coatesbacteria bacterium]
MSDRSPVSVVIPTYNSQGTIHRAVSSVLAQTSQPLEIIVVDDGSIDSTVSTVEHLSRSLSPGFLKFVRLESNHGCYYARNVGWDLAGGEFLALLDADDSWHPRKLEIQARYMLQHTDVVLTGHRCSYIANERAVPNIPANWSVSRMSSSRLLMFWCDLCTPSLMVRREFPFRFDAAKRFSGDRLFLLQVA